jgi:ligand-binding sensor domain-containing protein/signal transduction histidine kinase
VESSAVALRFGTGIFAMIVLGAHSISAQTRTAGGPVKLPVIDKHDIRFTRLSVNGNSLQSRINGIVQDDYGFLWFGTSDGLYKYDGYNLKRYRHERESQNSVAEGTIRALYNDRDGSIWIGSDTAGLYRLDPSRETFTQYRHESGKPGTLANDNVCCIYRDRAGKLWIGTNGGLDRLEAGSGTFIHYRNDPRNTGTLSNNAVVSLCEDQRGDLWVGTAGGLNKLDRATGRFSRFLHDPANPHSIGHNYVSSILEDQSGVLWLGSAFGDGLSALDVKTGEFTRYSFHAEEQSSQGVTGVEGIFADRDGSLWVCTIDRGLLKLNRQRRMFFRYANEPDNPNSMPSDSVHSVLEDAEGEMWVGTISGLSRFQRRAPSFVTYKHQAGNPKSLHNDVIWSVQADSQGSLWIAGEDGLNRLDQRTGQFTFYQHNPKDSYSLSYNKVAGIREDGQGTLWFGTYGGGLDRFDRTTGRFFAYRHDPTNSGSLSSDAVYSLLIDRQGTLWVGTQGGGLDRFDARTGRFTSWLNDPPNPDSMLTVLFEDRSGMIWVGTQNEGLKRFDPRTKELTSYRHNPDEPQSLSETRVNAIGEDQQGRLWIGTDNGLDLLDRNRGAFTVFTTSEGLPDNVVKSILVDSHGYLWLGTHNGLSRFDPQTKTSRNYFETDGLAGNFLNPYASEGSCQAPDGEMIFGSSSGVTAFYPERVYDNPYVPPVRLTGFLLFNKQANPGRDSPLIKSIWGSDSLTLAHRQSIFTLEFAALSYIAPEMNRYRYRLESLEGQWNEVDGGRRSATYTNLPAGKYTFQVQGSNNDGVWNNKGVSLAITVLPPWWGTWWFRSILSLTIAAFIFGAYRARIRQLNLRFEDRLAERTHIAQELHDTLIQDMVAFGLQLDIIEDQIDGESGAAKSTLDVVRDRVREAISRGRHALLDLRSSTATTNDLIESLSRAGTELSTGEVPRFRAFVQGTQCPLHSLIWHELDRIGREAITNAFRHAGAGSIEAGLLCSDHAIHLVVRDDGCGMTTSLVSKGRPGHFGLHGMRERAERAGGRLTVRSRHGGGTEVSVTIPLRGPHKARALLTRVSSLWLFGRWIEPPGPHENYENLTEPNTDHKS